MNSKIVFEIVLIQYLGNSLKEKGFKFGFQSKMCLQV